MNSLRTRFILISTGTIIIICIIFGIIAISSSKKSSLLSAQNSMLMVADQIAQVIKSKLEKDTAILEAISERDIITDSTPWEEKVSILQKEAERTGFKYFGFSDLDGNAFLFNKSKTSANISDRSYFKNASLGEPSFSYVVNKGTGTHDLAIAVPVKRDGQIIGLFLGFKDGRLLSDMVRGIKFGQNGYIYIGNNEGTCIAHPSWELVQNRFNPIQAAAQKPEYRELADAIREALQKQRGSREYHFNGRDILMAYNAMDNHDRWLIAVSIPKDEILAESYKLQRNILILTVILSLLGAGIGFGMGRLFTSPILSAIKQARHFANLDLSEDMPGNLLKRQDEIGDLARAFQELTVRLRSTLISINQASEQLAASSQEMTAVSEQTARTAEEIARTIEEITKGAVSQAQDTERGAAEIAALGSIIEASSLNILELIKSIEEVEKLKNEGLEVLKTLLSKTDESNQAAGQIFTVIQETSQSAEGIKKASQVIRSIAEQTNLLALNAAIEAARAGDAGRGFAVVAEEVRKLAEESANSIQDIENIINELSLKTSSAVNTMLEVKKIVDAQAASVEDTREKFDGIARAVEKTAGIIAQVTQLEQEMNQKKEHVVEIIQNLSAIAEENAAGTEEAAASVEEQTAAIQEITRASHSLAALAEEMQNQVRQFKI